MTKKEAIMIIADQDNGNPAEIVAATEYLMSLEERKTGKWEKDIYGNVVCSECKRKPICGNLTAYCPHCGAKMEGFE